MSNPIIDGLLSQLEEGMIDAAKQVGAAAIPDAKQSAQQFLSLAIPSLERWALGMFASPQAFTKEDVKILLEDLSFDGIVHLITLAGMVEIEVDKAHSAILKLATGVAMGALGKIIPL